MKKILLILALLFSVLTISCQNVEISRIAERVVKAEADVPFYSKEQILRLLPARVQVYFFVNRIYFLGKVTEEEVFEIIYKSEMYVER